MVRDIADNPTSSGLPVLILGKTSAKNWDLAENRQREVMQVESLDKARDLLLSSNAAGLIITRDMQNITSYDISDLLHILRPTRFLLFWPSDEMIHKFIGYVPPPGEKGDTKNFRDEELQNRISTLETRNASLEATIRTLIAALSQYDPWPEVYAGDEKAWDLIMQNVPVADQDSGEFHQPYDDNSQEDDEYEEE